MQVVRQDEPMLITAVTELSRGAISEATHAFLKSLEGHLPVSAKEKRVLFSTNDAVTVYNQQQIHKLPGRMYTYTSRDEGLKEDLAKLPVQKVNTFILSFI